MKIITSLLLLLVIFTNNVSNVIAGYNVDRNLSKDYFILPTPLSGSVKKNGTHSGTVAFFNEIGVDHASTTVTTGTANLNNHKSQHYFIWDLETEQTNATYTVQYDVYIAEGDCRITSVVYADVGSGYNINTDSYIQVGNDLSGSASKTYTATTTNETLTYTGQAGRYGFGYAVGANTGTVVCEATFVVYSVKRNDVELYDYYSVLDVGSGGNGTTSGTTTVNINIPENTIELITLSTMVFTYTFISLSSAFLLIYVYRIRKRK